jgi:hypothetical protein
MNLLELATNMKPPTAIAWLACVFWSGSVLWATEPSGASSTPTKYILVSFEEFEGVIVPEEHASSFPIPPAGWLDHVEYWTPGLDDVLRIERGVKKYLKRVARKQSPWYRLRDYRRQYIGYVMDGRKRIYCNFFCDFTERDWRNVPVQVDDGGSCYFQVDYDVPSNRFLSWSLNAP